MPISGNSELLQDAQHVEKLLLDKKVPSGMAHAKACIDRIAEAIEAQGDLDERVSRAKAGKERFPASVAHALPCHPTHYTKNVAYPRCMTKCTVSC